VKGSRVRVSGFGLRECFESIEVVRPHGGVRPFHQKSTCITQLTSGPCVVQPDSGLAFDVKVLKKINVFPSRSASVDK